MVYSNGDNFTKGMSNGLFGDSNFFFYDFHQGNMHSCLSAYCNDN